MGSTEHEDSGMEDILDSIRRIISDEPLENELPQAAIAQAPPQVTARAETTPGGPGSSAAPSGAGSAGAPAATSPNVNGINPATPPAFPATARSAPANNANVTSQLANALESHPPQPAPTPPVAPTAAPYNAPTAAPHNAAPVDDGIHNSLNSRSGNDIMDLTHPVSVPISQEPAIAPPSPMQPDAPQTAGMDQPAQTPSTTNNAPTNIGVPPMPMPTPTPTRVEGAYVRPQQAPLPPQEKIQTVEEPAVASMTPQQFNSPPMSESPTPAQAIPKGAAQPSPVQASPPAGAAPATASPLNGELSPSANPLRSENKPVWRDDVDAAPQTTEPTPKSNGINALNDALVGVSIATPHAQSPAEQEDEGTTAELNSPVIPTDVQPLDQSGENAESIAASSYADLPDEGAKRSPTEQAMRDLLKPMIKTWLDDNMPRMVEEVLRDEVRLAGKSDD